MKYEYNKSEGKVEVVYWELGKLYKDEFFEFVYSVDESLRYYKTESAREFASLLRSIRVKLNEAVLIMEERYRDRNRTSLFRNSEVQEELQSRIDSVKEWERRIGYASDDIAQSGEIKKSHYELMECKI